MILSIYVLDTESTNGDLVVELPEIDTLTWKLPNVPSNVITSDVESILKNKYQAEDNELICWERRMKL